MAIISQENNHEDFVTYEQAVDLKRYGFDWECNHYYDCRHDLVEYTQSYETSYSNWNHESCQDFWQYSAPTLAQAQKWLREERGIDIVISPRFDSNSGERIGYFWRWSQRTDVNKNPKTHKSYESALSDAISTILKPFENYE